MQNVSMMEETLRKMRKHGSQTIEVTQSLEAFGRYKPRPVPFEERRTLTTGPLLCRQKTRSPISNHRRGSLPLVSYFCHPVGSV